MIIVMWITRVIKRKSIFYVESTTNGFGKHQNVILNSMVAKNVLRN